MGSRDFSEAFGSCGDYDTRMAHIMNANTGTPAALFYELCALFQIKWLHNALLTPQRNECHDVQQTMEIGPDACGGLSG